MRPLSFDFERGKTASLGTAQRNQRSPLDFLSGLTTEVAVLEQLLLRHAVGLSGLATGAIVRAAFAKTRRCGSYVKEVITV